MERRILQEMSWTPGVWFRVDALGGTRKSGHAEALERLRKQGLVTVRTMPKRNGRSASEYHLTPEGEALGGALL